MFVLRAVPGARPPGLFLALVLFFGACLGSTGEAGAASASLEEAAHFYPARYYRDTADSAAAAVLTLAAGQSRSNIEIELDRAGGTIEGRLQTQGGIGPQPVPLAGVLVEAWARGHRVLTRSGTDGTFRLTGVPAGDVVVRYSTDDVLSRETRYQALFHPGVAEFSQAARIALTDGATVSLGSLLLRRSARLGGVVQAGDTGEPLGGVEIRIIAADRAALPPTASPWAFPGDDGLWRQRTNAEGRFLQGGLPPGEYTVWAGTEGVYIAEYLGGSRDPDLAQSVTLSGDDEQLDLRLTPDPGGVISGEVRHEGSSEPLNGVEVRATDQATGRVYAGVTGEYGSYAILGLPTGRYVVYVPAIRKYFPDSYKPEEARAVSVTEPLTAAGISLEGLPGGECQLSPQSRGSISGAVLADFATVERAVVRAWTDSDTVETPIEFPGPYTVECLRPGDYRVAFLCDGALRLQFHKKVNRIEEATIVQVTTADTSDAVDFTPEAAIRLEGRVRERASGVGLAGVRVRAVEVNTGAWAQAETAADGSFVLNRLGLLGATEFRTGLPAGSWRVSAESTLVEDPTLTPVLQPTILARLLSDGRIEVEWELPPVGPWAYRVECERAGSAMLVAEGTTGPTEPVLRVIDAPDPGLEPVRYRLLAWESGSSPESGFEAWSDWIAVHPVSSGRGAWSVRAAPSPWNGQGVVGIQLFGETGRAAAARSAPAGLLRIFSADGRTWASQRLPAGEGAFAWDGRDAQGRPAPSGVYLLHWLAEGSGISAARADGLLLLVR